MGGGEDPQLAYLPLWPSLPCVASSFPGNACGGRGYALSGGGRLGGEYLWDPLEIR